LSLSSDILVSKLAFKFNLYRYIPSQWLRRKDTSPMTGAQFQGAGARMLLPNHAMRSQVEEWRSQHPDAA
jgi:hypothetical protein